MTERESAALGPCRQHLDPWHPRCEVHDCCIGRPARDCRAPAACWLYGTGVMNDPDNLWGATLLCRLALLFCATPEALPVFGAWARAMFPEAESTEWADLNLRPDVMHELEAALQRGRRHADEGRSP